MSCIVSLQKQHLTNSWALFPSTQAGIFLGLAPWILRKRVHGAVIYKSLSNLLLLLVIKLFQVTNLLMAGAMLQIIFHTEELEVAAESSNGLGWWFLHVFLQRRQIPPRAAGFVPPASSQWQSHRPELGPCCFAGRGGDRPACEKAEIRVCKSKQDPTCR